MNLALESLIRNKVIQNSFHTQCSIAVWNEFKLSPQWITVKKEETSDDFLVTQWLIDQFQLIDYHHYDGEDEYVLPPFCEFQISQEDLFKPDVVIPQELYPIRVVNSSVLSHMNSYKKPMSQDVYESYFENMLKPTLHLEFKKYWLWNCFMFSVLDANRELRQRIQDYLFYNDIQEFNYLCQEEMDQAPYHISELWESLQEELFITEPEATGELVFASIV